MEGKIIHEDLSAEIIGAAMAVLNELKPRSAICPTRALVSSCPDPWLSVPSVVPLSHWPFRARELRVAES